MAEIDQSDVDRLTKIVRSISSSFEGVREAAASRFHQTLQRLGLNPGDIAVVVVNSDEVIADEFRSQIEDAKRRRRQVERENDALRTANKEMLDFLRDQHPKDYQRFARQPVSAEWKEFEELIRTRVFGGKLPKHWQDTVAPSFDTTVARMQRWAAGTATIQPEVMQMLHELPAPEVSPLMAETMSHKVRASRLSATVTLEAARLIFSGISKDDVAMRLDITKAQATGIEWTSPPRWRIEVPRSGPVDWMQLWQMETSISGLRKWRASALSRIGLPEDYAYTDDLNAASPEAIQCMRDEYFAKDPYLVFERIALRLAKQHEGRKLGWAAVFNQMRTEGVSAISNTEGPRFAAHFNAERFELFEIYKKTVRAHEDSLKD